jgi:hypothetical protein
MLNVCKVIEISIYLGNQYQQDISNSSVTLFIKHSKGIHTSYFAGVNVNVENICTQLTVAKKKKLDSSGRCYRISL